MSDKGNGTGLRIFTLVLAFALGAMAAILYNKVGETTRGVKVRYEDWAKLNIVLDEISNKYVDTVDYAAVTDAAVSAAMSALDPHSVYIPPVQLEASEEDLAGNFDGIGIQFNVPNDTAIVLEVIPGGPAEKVGLQTGDRILKVDEKVIAGVGFPQDDMVKLMKGPAGTKVKITVGRAGETIPFDITRGRIPIRSVDASFMLDSETAYVRLTRFSRNTITEFKKATSSLVSQGMTKLIFDLRDNSGGYFDQAILLSEEFLPKNAEIVYLEGLRHPREDYKADGKGKLKDVELVVLINENSASSSEIFAGAIQDNDRGTLVGRRTYGKGLVQEPVYFTDGSGIRLTVARFYTPSGRCIQKPYSDDYAYDIYKRYASGEVFSRDSLHVDTTDVHKTLLGRTVYGGGGIVPDVFVPVDTTRATKFFAQCNKKATQMRFASRTFDRNRSEILKIKDFKAMDAFFKAHPVLPAFRSFASSTDGITATNSEFNETAPYLEPQLKALIARYSQLGEDAFYKYYLPIDETVEAALKEF